jgi:uncharacterized protein YjbJ (UPF0337 family)
MKEKIKGRANLLAGGVKARIGEVIGREDLLVEGKLQQVKGAAQMARTEIETSVQLVAKMVKAKAKELGKAAQANNMSRVNKASEDAQKLVEQGGQMVAAAIEQAGGLAVQAVSKLTESLKDAGADPAGTVKKTVRKAKTAATQTAATATAAATTVAEKVSAKARSKTTKGQ